MARRAKTSKSIALDLVLLQVRPNKVLKPFSGFSRFGINYSNRNAGLYLCNENDMLSGWKLLGFMESRSI